MLMEFESHIIWTVFRSFIYGSYDRYSQLLLHFDCVPFYVVITFTCLQIDLKKHFTFYTTAGVFNKTMGCSKGFVLQWAHLLHTVNGPSLPFAPAFCVFQVTMLILYEKYCGIYGDYLRSINQIIYKRFKINIQFVVECQI